jgi:hypothetical protein
VWDTEDYEMKALVTRDNKFFKEIPLRFSGQPSLFTASFETMEKGNYEIIVYAYNPNNGNTGVDRIRVQVM